MKVIIALLVGLSCLPLYGAGIRGRNRVANHSNHKVVVNELVYEQKVVEGYLNAPLQIVAVPVTGLGPDYYWTDGIEEIRNMKVSDEDIERISNAVIAKFKAEFTVNNGVNTTPESPETTPEETPQGEIDELTMKVEEIFINHCVTCHGDNTQNGFTLLNKVGDTYIMAELDRLTKWNIYDRVQGGAHLPTSKRMPKNQEPLSDEDVETIQQWARESK